MYAMRLKLFSLLSLCLIMLLSFGAAEGLAPLPMDSCVPGPAPAREAFLSPTEYEDESISVKLYSGRYADTDYFYAHIKITHPSQLRAAPAGLLASPERTFSFITENRGTLIAKAANAVIAINGDYYTNSDRCHVVLRQGRQIRNFANGTADVLAVDVNGDFSVLKNCTKQDYKNYYEQMGSQLYNVFTFGPLLVENGESVIPMGYNDSSIGSQKQTQRAAIAQLGPLEYMIIATNGPQSNGNKGMIIEDFAHVCEMAGKELNENGCRIAYNLDGGGSATLVFWGESPDNGQFKPMRVNSTDISERHLSDMIYFATLVK